MGTKQILDPCGRVLPKVDDFCGKVPYRKVKRYKSETRVRKFLESDLFQKFCNSEEANIGKYGIMQIATGMANRCYEVGNDDVIEDFRISIQPAEGARLYKAARFINRPTHISEESISYVVSYYVCRRAGKWIAELVLDDDKWLDIKNVNATFDYLVEKNGYANSGPTEMKEVCLKFEGGVPFSTKAWVRPVKENSRYLICLMDNGKLLDLPADEVGVEKVNIPENGYLKTKFNWFQNQGWGMYIRMK